MFVEDLQTEMVGIGMSVTNWKQLASMMSDLQERLLVEEQMGSHSICKKQSAY